MRPHSLAHRLVPFAVFGAVALSVPALAQSTGSSGSQPGAYPACTTPPSKDDSEVAHGAYIAGKRAFDENDYPTAILYFKDAFRRDCTKYELLNIISRSYELKGDKPEAINALETYLKRAPAGDPSLESIQKRLASLKAQAAAEASAKASASASATSPPPTASASALPPPTASASSPPPERGHTLPPYFLMAGGVVALGIGIPLAIVGAGGVSDANSRITALGCDPDSATCPGKPKSVAQQATDIANGDRKTAQIEEGVGVALLGVGAAAVIGGLVWHFVEPTSQAPTQGTHIGVRPDARPGYAGISLGGGF